jgi:hypothetical protein
MKSLLGVRIGLFVVLCLMLFLSCSEKVTVRTDSQEEFMFTINGVLVKDMNLGKDVAYFSVLRDGKPFGGAVATVGTDTLANEGNGNYYLEGFPLFSFGQNVSIDISCAGDNFTLNTSVLIPGSFQILYFTPPIVTSDKAHLVIMYGSASVGASGYFTSIIRPDGSDGYTGLISLGEMIDGKHLPRDTFGEGGTFITGTYEVYAVSYVGSFLYYPGMEFYLPAGLPSGNIQGANGTIGAGVIAPPVSLEAE